MKRRILRNSLLVCLVLSAAFAAWTWFRPYAWHPDSAARCHIVETLVTRDQSFFWVDVHLKVNPGMIHDLHKPVWLETATGKTLEPADTTFAGNDEQNTTDIWLKFWLEAPDLHEPLKLQLNEGKLTVKAREGVPQLGSANYGNFTTNQW